MRVCASFRRLLPADGAYRSDGVAPPVFHAVPPPRIHLTRYHGVFAPHSRLRAAIKPADRWAGGKGAKPDAEVPAAPNHVGMSWAQRLRRVFAIEIETCARCQGRLRVIASIEEPAVIARILAHRDRESGGPEAELAPIAARAPPRQGVLLRD